MPTTTPIIVCLVLDDTPDEFGPLSCDDGSSVGWDTGTSVVEEDTVVMTLPDTVTMEVTNSTLCDTVVAGFAVVFALLRLLVLGGNGRSIDVGAFVCPFEVAGPED